MKKTTRRGFLAAAAATAAAGLAICIPGKVDDHNGVRPSHTSPKPSTAWIDFVSRSMPVYSPVCIGNDVYFLSEELPGDPLHGHSSQIWMAGNNQPLFENKSNIGLLVASQHSLLGVRGNISSPAYGTPFVLRNLKSGETKQLADVVDTEFKRFSFLKDYRLVEPGGTQRMYFKDPSPVAKPNAERPRIYDPLESRTMFLFGDVQHYDFTLLRALDGKLMSYQQGGTPELLARKEYRLETSFGDFIIDEETNNATFKGKKSPEKVVYWKNGLHLLEKHENEYNHSIIPDSKFCYQASLLMLPNEKYIVATYAPKGKKPKIMRRKLK